MSAPATAVAAPRPAARAGDVLVAVPDRDGGGRVLATPVRAAGPGAGAGDPVVVVVSLDGAALALAGVPARPGDLVQALAPPAGGPGRGGAGPAAVTSAGAGSPGVLDGAGLAGVRDGTGVVVAELRRLGAVVHEVAGPAGSPAPAAGPVLLRAGPRPAVVLGVVDPPSLATWYDLPGALRAVLDRWARALGTREVLLAAPRSFCAGVERAVEIVERALARTGGPVYVRRQIVHNAHVVAGLRARGAVFVEELHEVPEGATVVLAAHGVAPVVRRQAEERGLAVIDATCPLVAKVHREVRRFAAEGRRIVLVGHAEHEEVEGTVGEAPGRVDVVADAGDVEALQVPPDQPLAYLTQTTLAVDETAAVVDALRRRFPGVAGPPADDICYATQNRQDAVRAVAARCDLVLVVGSANSSNTQRLVEVARRAGCRAELVEDESELRLRWLHGVSAVGVTAGASAPEALVRRVVDVLSSLGDVTVSEHRAAEEHVRFALPTQVR